MINKKNTLISESAEETSCRIKNKRNFKVLDQKKVCTVRVFQNNILLKYIFKNTLTLHSLTLPCLTI